MLLEVDHVRARLRLTATSMRADTVATSARSSHARTDRRGRLITLISRDLVSGRHIANSLQPVRALRIRGRKSRRAKTTVPPDPSESAGQDKSAARPHEHHAASAKSSNPARAHLGAPTSPYARQIAALRAVEEPSGSARTCASSIFMSNRLPTSRHEVLAREQQERTHDDRTSRRGLDQRSMISRSAARALALRAPSSECLARAARLGLRYGRDSQGRGQRATGLAQGLRRRDHVSNSG